MPLIILKRLSIWAIETIGEAALLVLAIVAPAAVSAGFMAGLSIRGFLSGMWAVLFGFAITGYLLTTGVVRAFWRNGRTWSYPLIAAALFEIHFEIMNIWAGARALNPDFVTEVRIAGLPVALGCTLVGTLVLRRWTRVRAS